MASPEVDGGMLTFEANHPKWSYARTDENGLVIEVAEKKLISHTATVGIYYWSRGRDFVVDAESMIQKDIRVNGEFYVCPVYQEGIERGARYKVFPVERMWGIGIPEDLSFFIENYKGSV